MSVAKKIRSPPALPEKIGICRKTYRSRSPRVNMHYAMRNDSAEPPLDDVDRSLVAQLQQDGRRPYREMARTLGVSEGKVRWRVRRLLDSGALRIAAIADPFRLGYKVQAFVLLRVSPGDHQRIVETLATWPEVVYLS